jgi:hypothetical protein
MAPEIIIVSGLPRSGTSLMMQMLQQGGIEIVTDNIRAADTDNPRGYCEFERAKTIERDTSWLPATRGKAFKMVSQLLYHLPPTETFRILFMERDLDEVLASQEKMLTRLGRSSAPREQICRAFTLHLDRLREWLARQANMAILAVRYSELVQTPREAAEHVRTFLGRGDVEHMASAVDPTLYRNRKAIVPA